MGRKQTNDICLFVKVSFGSEISSDLQYPAYRNLLQLGFVVAAYIHYIRTYIHTYVHTYIHNNTYIDNNDQQH